MTDFLDLAASPTIRVHIKHPDAGLLYAGTGKNKKPLEVEIYGEHTRQYKEAAAKIGKEYIKDFEQGEASKALQEEAGCKLLAEITKALHGFEEWTFNNEPVTLNNVLALYLEDGNWWLRDQLSEKTGDRLGFFPKAQKGR